MLLCGRQDERPKFRTQDGEIKSKGSFYCWKKTNIKYKTKLGTSQNWLSTFSLS